MNVLHLFNLIVLNKTGIELLYVWSSSLGGFESVSYANGSLNVNCVDIYNDGLKQIHAPRKKAMELWNRIYKRVKQWIADGWDADAFKIIHVWCGFFFCFCHFFFPINNDSFKFPFVLSIFDLFLFFNKLCNSEWNFTLNVLELFVLKVITINLTVCMFLNFQFLTNLIIYSDLLFTGL